MVYYCPPTKRPLCQSPKVKPATLVSYEAMEIELTSGAEFLGRLLLNNKTHSLCRQQIEAFKQVFRQTAYLKFREHWFPENAVKGSGFRCVRINGALDPLIEGSFRKMGLSRLKFRSLFPREVSVWIDPGEVCMRIGEQGSICVIYNKDKPVVSDEDSLPTSPSSSPLKNFTRTAQTPSPTLSLTSPIPLKRHNSFSSSSSSSSSGSESSSPPSSPPSPPSSGYFPLFQSPSSSPVHHMNYHQQQLATMLMMRDCKDSFRGAHLDSVRDNRIFVTG